MEQLQSLINQFCELLKQNYIDQNAVASGELSNGIKGEILVQDKSYIVSISLPEQWKYVEYGRKPGKFPPLNAIKDWIKIKPILPRPAQNGKLPTENQLAFLIGRKIARDGIYARPILSQTKQEFDLVRRIYDECARDILSNVKFMWGDK